VALTGGLKTSDVRGRKAVFFDKDGTLITNVPYNVDPRFVFFAEGAELCLTLLHKAGYKLVIVSNQSGVARGYFKEEALAPVAERLNGMFEEVGVPLLGFYYCPHHPEGSVSAYAIPCSCRKPAPGLLLRAAADHEIDLSGSWVVGDILDDVEAGAKAGCRTALVKGGETEWHLSPPRTPDVLAEDLVQAAVAIVTSGIGQ
jgi:D-glycero-D-manno-heptose 1,7-bisphosphate phosphatase